MSNPTLEIIIICFKEQDRTKLEDKFGKAENMLPKHICFRQQIGK